MIVRSREDRKLTFPDFSLSGTVLRVCDEVKYLGHYLTDKLSNRDISIQCRIMYAQAKMPIRKFGMCSVSVRTTLYRAHCTPMYTAHLWRCYRKSSMQKLNVAYNDGLRLLLKVARWSSASQLFVSVGVPTYSAVLRNLMYRYCICVEYQTLKTV